MIKIGFLCLLSLLIYYCRCAYQDFDLVYRFQNPSRAVVSYNPSIPLSQAILTFNGVRLLPKEDATSSLPNVEGFKNLQPWYNDEIIIPLATYFDLTRKGTYNVHFNSLDSSSTKCHPSKTIYLQPTLYIKLPNIPLEFVSTETHLIDTSSIPMQGCMFATKELQFEIV